MNTRNADGGRLSTSALRISGDIRQPVWNRWIYRVWHSRRNRRENTVPFDPEVPWPAPGNRLAGRLDELTLPASPSRVLCNLFWLDIDWHLLEATLGSLRIHDIGCGRGPYAAFFRKAAGKKLPYSGYDIRRRPEWATLADADTRFTEFDGTSFASTFEDRPNILTSQSVLEHVSHDLGYFRATAEYAAKAGPLVQVHMFPGATGLPQYDLHGLRQYTRDSIRAIRSVLPADARLTLFCLGDPRYEALHMRLFRKAASRRRFRTEPELLPAYKAELAALLRDPVAVGADQAAFLCLIVELGMSEPLAGRLMRQGGLAAAPA